VGSAFFQAYVANINRMHLIELIETCQRDCNPRAFRASLVENPVTGRPYAPHVRAQDLSAEH
jgi:hypothetical protein